ncbi:hypothetical protein OKA05_22145 [Luteolibacter arcticus]|uniref:HEAT repeat domain-containing protein n=1 Tax=Luteolibacter arcticus TaxID=1581411 RepID=A0ABT3GP84_9BACT|nr:hypothetical protein [Luteolibacter arcticus]MCW1925278.1 hypothetical protein [Luteolibacter arcticus]
MKERTSRTHIPAALLLLVATHAAVFLLARAVTGFPGTANAPRDSLHFRPTKVSDRSTDEGPQGISGSFTRRLRELEESKLPRRDFELAREALFREWIIRDLRGAMGQLYAPEHRRRYKSLAETLHAEVVAEIARQPRAVWDWIASHHFGSVGPEVFDLWSKTLATAGQTDILLECLSQPGAPHFVDRDTVGDLCEYIPPGAAAQLAALRKWIEIPGNSEDEGPAADFALRMAEEVGADPLPFLTAEPNEMLRSIFLEKWERQELGSLPVVQQVQRIAALPEEFRAAAADAMVHHERGDTVAAVDLINAMEAAGLMGDPAGETAQALAKSALNWVMEDGSTTALESIQILQAIRADPLRRQALRDFGSLYSNRAPSPVQDCVAALPTGPDRDAFISGVVFHGDFPKETRAQLLTAIQDPQIAARARLKVEELYQRQDEERRREKADGEAAGDPFAQ